MGLFFSGPHRRDQRLGADDGDGAFEIVGQNMQAPLGGHVIHPPGLEVGGSHPGLQGSKDVLDGLSSDAHGLGVAVQHSLHGLDDGLVLPAGDAMLFGRGAMGFRAQFLQAERFQYRCRVCPWLLPQPEPNTPAA